MSYQTIERVNNPLYLNFKGVEIKIVDHKGKPWITAADAGRCLGYAHPEKAVNKLYRRHKDRFKPDEVAEIEMEMPYEMRNQSDSSCPANHEMRNQSGSSCPAKKRQPATRKMKVRIFSLRGGNRLAIYANTPVAWEFHDWILDMIEGNSRSLEL
ncbi:MAG: hypothetical protein LBI31_01575 [Zoogloeaceae bacterium]|jgi:prophage antirepressor-like protein|nr:hypothetical protein [Zoogloeaceae bacterium]